MTEGTASPMGWICPYCNVWVGHGELHKCSKFDEDGAPIQYVLAPWDEILVALRKIIAMLEDIQIAEEKLTEGKDHDVYNA